MSKDMRKFIDIAKNYGKPINENLGVASDGGYYSKSERSIIVTKDDANFINNAIEEFKRVVQTPETPILVNNSEKGKINLEIINDLRKHWGINFENDNEEGNEFFWLSPNQNIQDLNDGLEYANQLFYDKIQ